MNWYYAESGKQAGPVDDAQFQLLVQGGHIRSDTLVWHEGLVNWVPYGQIQQPAMASTALGPDEAACVECGRAFRKQDMIAYGGSHVCAECKPAFLQKLSEGVPIASRRGRRALPVDPEALVSEIVSRDYTLDIGSCISRAYYLVKDNLGLTVGATLLIMLCSQAAGFVPLLGAVLSLILSGPLTGGLYVFYLKLIRGEDATIGDAFSGFSPRFWPLCGTMLLMVLLIYASLIPAGVAAAVYLSASQSLGVLFWVLLGLGLLGSIFLGVAFLFAVPLAADMELGPWESLKVSYLVVRKHWFVVFGLAIVAGVVSALGLLLCIVGVLLTLPMFYAALMYAYEDIFQAR